MRKVFDFEGPIFVFLSRAADLLWLNILFMICSIPVFTIGASATALYYVTLKMARNEEGYITKSFFKSFKDNFKQATCIWLIILLIGTVIFMDYRVVTDPALASIIPSTAIRNIVMVASMVMTIIVSFITIYVFPILAKFDNSVRNTIRNAFLMSIRHLPQTLLLILIAIVPAVIMYFSVALMILIVYVFSLVAFFSSKIFVKIFDNYLPKEELSTNAGGVNEEEA